jgi:hypothetical protein
MKVLMNRLTAIAILLLLLAAACSKSTTEPVESKRGDCRQEVASRVLPIEAGTMYSPAALELSAGPHFSLSAVGIQQRSPRTQELNQ